MKTKIYNLIKLAICLLVFTSFSSPCQDAFSIGYATAQSVYVNRDCGGLWAAHCHTEYAQMFDNEVNRLINDYNTCVGN
jgi:hypothetical protein